MIGSTISTVSFVGLSATDGLASLAAHSSRSVHGFLTTDSAFTLLRLLSPEAGEGHEAAHTFLGVPFLYWQIANLVLFLALLVYFLKKPLASFFTGRRLEVEQALRTAEEKRLRAEALAAEITARMGRIERELAELKTHADKEAAAEQRSLTAQTEADAARIVARASAEIDSRVRSARQELTSYAGDLAVEIAEDILKKNLTPEDQNRFLRDGVVALNDLSPRSAAKPSR
ncbi:MAG: ATP synthase F0 subunit B [Thermoanaerobaculia bacterium]